MKGTVISRVERDRDRAGIPGHPGTGVPVPVPVFKNREIPVPVFKTGTDRDWKCTPKNCIFGKIFKNFTEKFKFQWWNFPNKLKILPQNLNISQPKIHFRHFSLTYSELHAYHIQIPNQNQCI